MVLATDTLERGGHQKLLALPKLSPDSPGAICLNRDVINQDGGSKPRNSLSTSQLTRDWTVITCVNGSTRNPRCSHLHMEPKLLSRGLSMALDVHLRQKGLLHLAHTKYCSHHKIVETASCSTYLYITEYLSSYTLYFTILFNNP